MLKKIGKYVIIVGVVALGIITILALIGAGVNKVKSCFTPTNKQVVQTTAPATVSQTDVRVQQLEREVQQLRRIAELERQVKELQERASAPIATVPVTPTSTALVTAPAPSLSVEERLALLDGNEELEDAIDRTKLSLAVMVSDTSRVPANVAAVRRSKIHSFRTGLARQKRQLAERKALLQ